MLDRERLLSLTPKLFLFFSILGFSALWYSTFVVSFCTGVLALLLIPFLKQLWSKNKAIVVVMACFALLGVLDVLRCNTEGIAGAKLGLLVGFAVVLSSAYIHFSKKSTAIYFILITSVIVLIINGIAVGNYLLNKAMYDELLLQSKSIPVLDMHHIHFGIINASILFLLFGILQVITVEIPYRKAFYAILVLIFIAFHILSSRTGVIAFYSGTFVSLFIYAMAVKKYKVFIVGVFLVSASFGLASVFSTSFKNKISNSVEDFRSIQEGGEEINFKSMAMRLEAGKMCFEIIKSNLFLGVGAAKQDEALQQMYIEQESELFPINRVGPHNQLLEFGVKYGVFGIVLILVFFKVWLIPFSFQSYLFYGYLTLIFVSMLFESLLERQASIYFISLFLTASSTLFKSHISNK